MIEPYLAWSRDGHSFWRPGTAATRKPFIRPVKNWSQRFMTFQPLVMPVPGARWRCFRSRVRHATIAAAGTVNGTHEQLWFYSSAINNKRTVNQNTHRWNDGVMFLHTLRRCVCA